jgi:hypothetical protein
MEAPPDNSHAPSPQQRKADVPPTSVVVMGDAMADWLAYGLEDALVERPEIGTTRKHRAGSGLIRYDPRRDVDWAQTAREIIAAEKPKFVVMMIGVNDHQAIRERAPAPRPAAPVGKPGAAPGPQSTPGQAAPRVPAPTEDVANPDPENPEQPSPSSIGPVPRRPESSLSTSGTGSSTSRAVSLRKGRISRARPAACAAPTASISPKPVPVSSPTMWSVRSIAAWPIALFRRRCPRPSSRLWPAPRPAGRPPVRWRVR